MAIPLQAGDVLVFSIQETGEAEQSFGIVQSVSFNNTTERAEAKGNDGNTISIQEYDDKTELSLTYLSLASGATNVPAIGTKFTWNTVDYYVSSVNRGQTVDGFETVDVTATKYPHV